MRTIMCAIILSVRQVTQLMCMCCRGIAMPSPPTEVNAPSYVSVYVCLLSDQLETRTWLAAHDHIHARARIECLCLHCAGTRSKRVCGLSSIMPFVRTAQTNTIARRIYAQFGQR